MEAQDLGCFVQGLQRFVFITIDKHMIKVIIFISSIVIAYCIGNLTGFVDGKNQAHKEMYEHNPGKDKRTSKQDLIDELARYSFVWDNKSNAYIKVYEAEIIEFPRNYNI